MQGDPHLSWAKKMVWCSVVQRVFATLCWTAFAVRGCTNTVSACSYTYMSREICQFPVVVLIAGQQYGHGWILDLAVTAKVSGP